MCAGEDGDSIRPTVEGLKAASIGAILDYAAEADVGENKRKDVDVSSPWWTRCVRADHALLWLPQVDRNELQSRTYDYAGEDECDKNAAITLKAIQAAAETKGFAAVKVTVRSHAHVGLHMKNVYV